MLNPEQINDLHRLYWAERWSIRKIERHLKMGWKTIRKYLEKPAQRPVFRQRATKIDHTGTRSRSGSKMIHGSAPLSSSSAFGRSGTAAGTPFSRSMCAKSART